MKNLIKITLGLALCVGLFAFAFGEIEEKAEADKVKELVMNAYVNGAFNDLDTKSMKEGFHEDFAIFSAKGEALSKYPIQSWLERTEKRKADGYEPDSEKNVWEPTFASIDVTGGAAQVKIELRNQGKHVFTDYLSLLKFESGWKIVAKVYHRHE